MLAYLRLLVNPQDTVSFLRIVNEPARGIGKVSLDKLQAYAAEQEIGLLAAAGQVAMIPAIKGKAATGPARLLQADDRTSRAARSAAARTRSASCSRSPATQAMLRESKDEDDADRLANVEELITAAKQFHDDESREHHRRFPRTDHARLRCGWLGRSRPITSR